MTLTQTYNQYMQGMGYDAHLQRFLGSRNYPPVHFPDLLQEARLNIWKRALKQPDLFEANTEAYVITAGYYGMHNKQVQLQRWDIQNREPEEVFSSEKHKEVRDPHSTYHTRQADIRMDLQIAWKKVTEDIDDDQAALAQTIITMWSEGHPLRDIAKTIDIPYKKVRTIYDETIQKFRDRWPDPEEVMPDEAPPVYQHTKRKRNGTPSYRHGRYIITLELPGASHSAQCYTKRDAAKYLAKHTGISFRKWEGYILNNRANTEWQTDNIRVHVTYQT